MERYTKEIDGVIYTKWQNEIVIEKDGKKIYNPPHEMLLADGWSVFQQNGTGNDDDFRLHILKSAKEKVLLAIDAHDTSTAVNEFFYGNVSFWLPRETRVSVRSTAQIMKDSGYQTMTLWLGDVSVTLALEEVLQMLSVLEVYALECYNTTARHKANVNALTDIRAVRAYDYTADYPEKIHF